MELILEIELEEALQDGHKLIMCILQGLYFL